MDFLARQVGTADAFKKPPRVTDLRAGEARCLLPRAGRGYPQQSTSSNTGPRRRLDTVIVLNQLFKYLETAGRSDDRCGRAAAFSGWTSSVIRPACPDPFNYRTEATVVVVPGMMIRSGYPKSTARSTQRTRTPPSRSIGSRSSKFDKWGRAIAANSRIVGEPARNTCALVWFKQLECSHQMCEDTASVDVAYKKHGRIGHLGNHHVVSSPSLRFISAGLPAPSMTTRSPRARNRARLS